MRNETSASDQENFIAVVQKPRNQKTKTNMQTLKLNEEEKRAIKLRAMASGYESFGGLVTLLKREGEARSNGEAIFKGRNLRGDLYNKWCEEGRPRL
jgi:hypothetical protein